MTSIDDERNAAKEAEAIIRSLSPSTPCDRETVNKLRGANRLAIEAMKGNFSSQTALNDARNDVGLKLPPLCKALDKGPAPRETIEAAKRAIEAWLSAIAKL
jgi:hypothetical protein